MSVFKRYQGKRITESDPNWSKGTWYLWKRINGKVIHKSLPGVTCELDAQEIERLMIRQIATQVEGKHAVKIARQISGLLSERPPEHIYIFESGGHFKIGRTNNVAKRLATITGTIIPFATNVIFTAAVKNAMQVEKTIHREFAEHRISGEWFLFERGQLFDVERRIIDLQENK